MKALVRALHVVTLLLGVAACTRSSVAPEVARALEDGRRWQRALAARVAPDSAADPAALVALGYLERARLGLGSPFRLVDFALNDARLPRVARERTAWAVLAMVYDRAAYTVPAAALDSLFVQREPNGAGAGAAHLALIDRVVREGSDPRMGEAAVRLAYTLAGAERLTRSRAVEQAARAAALVRDRELARTDLLALFREARTRDIGALELVSVWRMGRRFLVESPRLAAYAAADDAPAVTLVPALIEGLRELASQPRDSTAAPVAPPLLSAGAAARLGSLGSVRAAPPQAPVVVPLAASRRAILTEPGIGDATRQARERFLDAARNEETFVAAYARLGARPGTQVASAALWTATTLRQYAQESVWFPGWAGPSAQELRTAYGITAVTFDREVPTSWRPYYRRMIASAVDDLRRVLPGLTLDGLRVHVGYDPLRASALALHDPRSRTIFLPVGTGAGAIAHELAHDLDWQVAARRLGRRGDYSTDEVVRGGNGPLASTLQALTSATLVPPRAENQFRAPHAQRPTEVFASSVDWYVAAALAREGRVNGYLTSVQDEVLTGYAAVSAPDVRGDAGTATISVLAQMTVVPDSTREWFLARYGHQRTATALDVVRRLLEATAPGRDAALDEGTAAGALASLPRCVDGETRERAGVTEQREAHRAVAELAAEALARRVVAWRGVPMPGGAVRVGTTWREGPWDPAVVDAELARVKGVILERAESLEPVRPFAPEPPRYLPDC